MAISAMTAPMTAKGWARIFSTSSDIPTEKKKTPSSSPLKGSIVTSISRRYSVSARMRPARNAPSAMERPLTAVTRLVPTMTSRQAAMNSSRLPVAATRRNSGLSR